MSWSVILVLDSNEMTNDKSQMTNQSSFRVKNYPICHLLFVICHFIRAYGENDGLPDHRPRRRMAGWNGRDLTNPELPELGPATPLFPSPPTPQSFLAKNRTQHHSLSP